MNNKFFILNKKCLFKIPHQKCIFCYLIMFLLTILLLNYITFSCNVKKYLTLEFRAKNYSGRNVLPVKIKKSFNTQD